MARTVVLVARTAQVVLVAHTARVVLVAQVARTTADTKTDRYSCMTFKR
jgi:hypothetical protein